MTVSALFLAFLQNDRVSKTPRSVFEKPPYSGRCVEGRGSRRFCRFLRNARRRRGETGVGNGGRRTERLVRGPGPMTLVKVGRGPAARDRPIGPVSYHRPALPRYHDSRRHYPAGGERRYRPMAVRGRVVPVPRRIERGRRSDPRRLEDRDEGRPDEYMPDE